MFVWVAGASISEQLTFIERQIGLASIRNSALMWDNFIWAISGPGLPLVAAVKSCGRTSQEAKFILCLTNGIQSGFPLKWSFYKALPFHLYWRIQLILIARTKTQGMAVTETQGATVQRMLCPQPQRWPLSPELSDLDGFAEEHSSKDSEEHGEGGERDPWYWVSSPKDPSGPKCLSLSIQKDRIMVHSLIC